MNDEVISPARFNHWSGVSVVDNLCCCLQVAIRRNCCVVDTKPVLAGDPFWPHLFIIDIDVKPSEEWLPCVTVSDPATSRVGAIARLPSVGIRGSGSKILWYLSLDGRSLHGEELELPMAAAGIGSGCQRWRKEQVEVGSRHRSSRNPSCFQMTVSHQLLGSTEQESKVEELNGR